MRGHTHTHTHTVEADKERDGIETDRGFRMLFRVHVPYLNDVVVEPSDTNTHSTHIIS